MRKYDPELEKTVSVRRQQTIGGHQSVQVHPISRAASGPAWYVDLVVELNYIGQIAKLCSGWRVCCMAVGSEDSCWWKGANGGTVVYHELVTLQVPKYLTTVETLR